MTRNIEYSEIEIHGDDSTLVKVLNVCENKVETLEGEKIELLDPSLSVADIIFKLADIREHQEFYLNIIKSIQAEQKRRRNERIQKRCLSVAAHVGAIILIVTLIKIIIS